MGEHEIYMQRCLQLALNGMGHVAPNPMVGCVVVHNGHVIGEGYHQQYGGPHAEVNAINSVQQPHLLPESTLYVSLEPCSHYGKTPPCADLILQKKIPRVVIAGTDPNPLVAGKGIERLRQNGVQVTTGVLPTEADFLNRRFITYHTQKRPYVILKWAQSADGFIAPGTGKQVWLTGNNARVLAHQWRTHEQAIMVGTNTALTDNPQLTARLWPGTNPLRVVIDKQGQLPPTHHLFNADAPTLVFTQGPALVKGNVEYCPIDFNHLAEEQMLQQLYERHIQSVIIEGGAALLNSYISKRLWDEARVFTAPATLQNGLRVNTLPGLPAETQMVGADRLEVWYAPKD